MTLRSQFTDVDGDDCAVYYTSPSGACGEYDVPGFFEASKLCCACGGGIVDPLNAGKRTKTYGTVARGMGYLLVSFLGFLGLISLAKSWQESGTAMTKTCPGDGSSTQWAGVDVLDVAREKAGKDAAVTGSLPDSPRNTPLM